MKIEFDSISPETLEYQDEQGRWQYTDRPRPSLEPPGEILPAPAATSNPNRDLNARLRAQFSPQTPVQEATLGTVTVKTAMGTGSGFFISTTGHLLTNRHVIKLPERERKEIQQSLGDAEQELDRYRKRLTWREQGTGSL
ncbi:MAG: serine protease [Candidatus Competibacteraceae bacterium]|nr:serine protease [Candidatus Competibacteraceae bacterium]